MGSKQVTATTCVLDDHLVGGVTEPELTDVNLDYAISRKSVTSDGGRFASSWSGSVTAHATSRTLSLVNHAA